MTQTALAVRHVAFEDLGSLEPVLKSAGYKVDYLEAGQDRLRNRLQNADLLIVLGGPISVNDADDYPFLPDVQAALRKRLQLARPTLGICLGAQLIAAALGARVYPGTEKEIGWSSLALTDAGQSSCLRHLYGIPVLHWHGETYELPQNANHLAATDIYRQQAFAIGNHVLGLQFHIEVTAAGLERWYIGHTVELAQAGVDINRLRQVGQTHAPVLQSMAETCMKEWRSAI